MRHYPCMQAIVNVAQGITQVQNNKTDAVSKIPAMIAEEPYAGRLGIKCLEVGPGHASCAMTVDESMCNIFGMAHGGAIMSLMDDAFQFACNSRGQTAYALNVNTTFVKGASPGDELIATAAEKSLTPRTGTYELCVKDQDGELIALAQAVAYRKKAPSPFEVE